MRVGRSSGATGTFVIDGIGSELDAAGALFAIGLDADLNNGGVGTVSVQNGGVLRAGEVRVGPDGTLGGNGSVDGTIIIQGGSLAPGLSPGILTADRLIFESGIIEIEFAGLLPGQFDQLIVLNDAVFNGGTILFSFIDFLPQVNDVIQFLLADLSTFENVNLAFQGVAPGFELDVLPTFGPGGGLQFIALNDALALPIPEPTTLTLFGAGLAGLGFMLWRRRRVR